MLATTSSFASTPEEIRRKKIEIVYESLPKLANDSLNDNQNVEETNENDEKKIDQNRHNEKMKFVELESAGALDYSLDDNEAEDKFFYTKGTFFTN